jgi:hypothetical protein
MIWIWGSTLHTRAGRQMVCAVLFLPLAAKAQEVKITLPSADVASSSPGVCVTEAPPYSTIPDKIKLHFYFAENGTPKAPDKSTIVQVNGQDRKTIVRDAKDDSFEIGRDELLNSNVTILREDTRTAICSVVPLSMVPANAPTGLNRTSFIADGEVGKVLRGATSGGATGSLGIDHHMEHAPFPIPENSKLRYIAWVYLKRFFAPWWSAGEELHAVITIAGSADSLFSDKASTYGAAILLPSIAGNGSIQGTTIEYHWFNRFGDSNGTFGPLFRLTTTRSFWVVVDTTATGTPASTGPPSTPAVAPTVLTFRQPLPLTSVDLGLRFTFINHPVDPKLNTFAMGLDPKVLWRIVTPNTEADDSTVVAAFCRHHVGTCSPAHKLTGVGLTLWISLRQVTASADLFHIGKPKSGSMDGLSGYQPAMRVSYSSPLFTF